MGKNIAIVFVLFFILKFSVLCPFKVIKWMLSKGQGITMGTYQQLIRALDMDHRAEEAHSFWMRKIGNDLHSVSWQACHLMISIYHRNNMLDRLVKVHSCYLSLSSFPFQNDSICDQLLWSIAW